MAANISSFLKDELAKPAEESKKWRMATIGLKGIAGFFLIGAVLILFQPAIAAHIATLVQFAFTAWGGIVALFLGAQGTVEYKTVAALETSQHTETRTETEHVFHEDGPFVYHENEGGPDVRPWAMTTGADEQ